MWLYKYPNSGRYCTELLYTDVKRITQKLDTRQTACYLVYQARPILSLDRLPYAPPPTSSERENRQPATINAYLIFLLIILTVHVELLLKVRLIHTSSIHEFSDTACSDVFKLCSGILLNFYLGLPHVDYDFRVAVCRHSTPICIQILLVYQVQPLFLLEM